ncbi:nucleoprotein TPR-like [Saccostrea echinata]|uniref:nucleoprotein TPR-like n=1 Tax=Saccostrea echinata TaxID=191078 RepID=UPI002A82EFB7|nr:nucleoprotein TPR-like [Saccostrea echinata]
MAGIENFRPPDLNNILEEHELNQLSGGVKEKIQRAFTSRTAQYEELKVKYERLSVTSEQRQLEVESQLAEIQGNLEKLAAENAQLKTELADTVEKLTTATEKLKSIQEEENSSLSTQLRLTKANETLESEKRDLTVLLEKRSKEIERLNEEWSSLSDKLAQANREKTEAQAQAAEFQSQVVTSQFTQKRLEDEKEALQRQIDLLNKDLSEKTQQLFNVRKEQSARNLDLQSRLEEQTDENQHLQNTIDALRKTNAEQVKKIEQYIEKLQDAHNNQVQADEQFRQELEANQKLSDLYKGQASDLEEKCKELMGAVDELRKLLKEASVSYTELQNQHQSDVEQLNVELTDRENQIQNLRKELENANELIEEIKKKAATSEHVETLFPNAAATSKLVNSGMSLTQIYNEYMQASENLYLEKEETKRLNSYIDTILQEIEEKAPLIRKQREDYEQSLETIEQMNKQLDAALLESQNMRIEADEANRKYNYMKRENQKLQQQTEDLSKQVQFLVKEIEEVKGRRIIQEDDISCVDISSTTSSEVISGHLVTFRNIEDLQRQNQRLLGVVRDLSEKRDEEESLAAEEKTKDLKEQLERALSEMQELKSARDRQATMVESIVRQRDYYRVLLQQKEDGQVLEMTSTTAVTPLKSPILRSPLKSPAHVPDKALEEVKSAFKQCQEEFDRHKTEMKEQVRMLNEELREKESKLSEMLRQNMKLSSQLEYGAERNKILQGNAEGYKKELASLSEKEKKLFSSVAKHEQTINTLRQDLLSTQEKLSRAEAQCHHLRTEKELLRSAEQRLLLDIDNLRREKTSQSMLMANLQSIQNTLEHSEREVRSRYTNKIEKLEMELNTARRNLKATQDEHKAVVELWENQTKQLRQQLEGEIKNHENVKKILQDTRRQLEEAKAQLKTTEANLVEAQRRSENGLRTAPVTAPDRAPPANTEEVKTLKYQVTETKREVQNLKEQLERGKQHVTEYKSIADNLQKALTEQTECTNQMEEQLRREKEEKQSVLERLKAIEGESQKQTEEMMKGLDEQHKLNGDLKKQLTKLQMELEEAVSTRDSALAREAASREECNQQVQMASEAKDKYQRELMLHAADVEALAAVKKQLEDFHSKLAIEQEIRIKAEKDLEEGRNSWLEQEKILKEECLRLEKRSEELSSQNDILHQQMEKMSNDVLSIQRAVTRSGSPQKLADLSFDEDTARSTEQLQEVIRFLRKEKEIAQSKLEIVQTECNNVKYRYETQKKELEDMRKALTEQQIKAQANVQTASQHADLMRKVENLNILTDSNKLLREDKNRLEQLVQELEAKVSNLEASVNPLQASIRDLTAEKEALLIERNTLKNEVDRWKSRANHLIEQANRTDPDEHRKILLERDALKLRVKQLFDESSKNSQEKEKLTRDLKTANEEQLRVKKALQDMTNTRQELLNRITNLQKELSQSQTIASSKEKEIFQLRNNLAEKENDFTQTKNKVSELEAEIQGFKAQIDEKVKDVEEKAKTINQLRKIGRKYKEQAESLNKEIEELKTKSTTEQASQPAEEETTPSQEEVDQQVVAIREQLTQAEQERDDLKQKLEVQSGEYGGTKMQLAQAQQEISQSKAEIDQLKKKNEEYEQKQNQSKNVLQAVKKKLSSQNEEIGKLTAENTELKQKVSAEPPSGATEEAESRMAAMKSTYENRISTLTKEVTDNAQQVRTSVAEIADKNKQLEQLMTEKAELQDKIAAMQKQIDAQPKPVAPQPQAARPAATVTVERARPVDRSSVSVAESPKTANIKPMSTSPAAVRPQVPTSQSQTAGSRVIANIRPMAIAPTSISPLAVSVPTPTATVMPTTVSQHDVTDSNEVTQAQLSPVMTSRPTQQVQRVTPQVEASADSSTSSSGQIIQEVPSIQEQTVTQSEVEVSSAASSATSDNSESQSTSTAREITPSTSSSAVTREVTPTTSVAPGARDTTSVSSVSREGQSLGKRSREETEGQGEETEPKRTKVSTAQGSPIPAITVTDEHANTLTVTEEEPVQEPGQEVTEVQTPQLSTQESEISLGPAESTDDLVEDLSSEPAALSDSQGQQNVEEIQEEEAPEEEEDGDDAIIILESDDEEDENEGIEEEEEDEDIEEEEEEEDIEEVEEDYNEDDEMEGEYTASQLEEIQEQTQTEGEEEDVIQLDDDSNDRAMEAQEEEVPQTTQSASISTPTVLFGQRGPFTMERQTSMNRQLAPFILGGQTGTFEEGEDGIVPSTPTLFVPNRGDGYAEVVSSPRISNQRFTFGALSESTLAQPELGELASQGALGGMESTSMDLSELDEGTGRSVPSTPLRTTAPVPVISEAAIASALNPQATATSSAGETTTAQPDMEETQEEVSVEEGSGEQAEPELSTEVTETTEGEVTTSAGETAGDTTEQEKEGAGALREEEPSTSQEKTEVIEKPKIQPIVWEGSPTSSGQQTRGRPISTRGTPQRGQLQNRGNRGGMFQRGRGAIQRARGTGRGNRGGAYRSPNMF